jgi:hypothetical protein
MSSASQKISRIILQSKGLKSKIADLEYRRYSRSFYDEFRFSKNQPDNFTVKRPEISNGSTL